MGVQSDRSSRTITAFTGELSRRQKAHAFGRATLSMLATAIVLGVTMSTHIGPAPSVFVVCAAWIVIFGLSLWAAVLAFGGVKNFRQLLHGALDLSELETALSFERAVPAGASHELAAAHIQKVQAALLPYDSNSFLPSRETLVPMFVYFFFATLSSSAIYMTTDATRAGLFALLHPGAHGRGEIAKARWISSYEVTVTGPDYLPISVYRISDAAQIPVIFGTKLDFTVHSRTAGADARIRIGASTIRLVRESAKLFRGTVIAKESGALHIDLAEEKDEWLEDALPRELAVTIDAPPVATWVTPTADREIELGESIELQCHATDDIGVAAVSIAVTLPNGRTVRSRIDDPRHANQTAEIDATTPWTAASVGARAGDKLRVRCEARDEDTVSGPKTGASEERVFTIASEETDRDSLLEAMQKLADEITDRLADRLETPMGADSVAKKKRVETLHVREFATAEFAKHAADSIHMDAHVAPALARDAAALRELASRLSHKLEREARAVSGSNVPAARATEQDRIIVDELETDALWLEDARGRAELENAASTLRELERTREQMKSLLSELRRNPSDEAKQQLLAQLDAAESKMAQLMEKLSRLSKNVPGEFLNADATQTEHARDALKEAREALMRGDYDAAEASLEKLEKELGNLQKAMEQSADSFSESRFSEEREAIDHAIEQLSKIEEEQRKLAQESGKVRDSEGQQGADKPSPETKTKLLALAEQAQNATRSIDREFLNHTAQSSVDSAIARFGDAKSAIAHDSIGDALQMTENANADLERLDSDLSMTEHLQPNSPFAHEERLRAHEALRAGHELEKALRDAMPQPPPPTPQQRQQMQSQSQRQSQNRQAAGDLSERTRPGAEHAPPVPGLSETLRDAASSMSQAEESLRSGDARGAHSREQEASDRLSEARESLEAQRNAMRGHGGTGEGEERENGSRGHGEGEGNEPNFDERVAIPSADAFRTPEARRRRVLDGMREAAPQGYESAARRYLQGLLR